MAEFSIADIRLNRRTGPEGGDRERPTSMKQPRSRRKPTPKKNDQSPKRKPTDSDERIRQVTAVLLFLGGLLLLLALVSYTPHDQANTDVGIGDLLGLFTNDPAVSARADTTENWLGLLGAFVSNALINGTIGYFTLFFPLLIGFWGLVVYRAAGHELATRISLYSLLVLTLLASVMGTVQLVEWMPHPSHEWSGAIGAFIGSILSGLTGTVGSFLLLLAGLLIAVLYAFQIDLRTAIAYARAWGAAALAKTSEARGSLSERLGRAPETDEGNTQRDGSESPGRRTREDDEPARMVRRMSGSDDEETIDPLPRKPRPTQEETSNRAQDRTVAGRGEGSPPPSTGTRSETASSANTKRENVEQPPARPTTPTPRQPAASGGETGSAVPPPVEPKDNSITITHQAPPAAPLVPDEDAPRLTLNVQEGETEEDLETENGGQLREKLKDEEIKYAPPPIELLIPQNTHEEVDDEELKANGRILQEKLKTFNIEIENLTVTPGPVVTLYEFVPAAGIKLSQIESLSDDIALALKARGIRIIAPIPGKGTVGVEIPNNKPTLVRIRSVLNTAKFREADLKLPLALGKTTVGEVFCDDLTKMPHLLIAGATGAGKSVGINSIIASLVYKLHPSELKFVIIDPKKIELTLYRSLKDHFLACSPDIDEDIITTPQNAVLVLKALEMEMDQRYDLLAKARQRNILDYNTKVREGAFQNDTETDHRPLPYMVLIIDELADLMITAAKEVEEPIARLAQLARAIGIHMIVATQRPSVDVITGMIKANFPARIAYQVASRIDSRTILDMSGAEQLLGNGDMLYLPGGRPKPMRLQNAFISTDEVEGICDHIGNQKGYSTPYMLPSVAEKNKKGAGGISNDRDDLFDEAARLVVRTQQGSVSLVQRRMKVGYARAARIIDELEMAGIVGPFDGSKAREVLVQDEDDLEIYL